MALILANNKQITSKMSTQSMYKKQKCCECCECDDCIDSEVEKKPYVRLPSNAYMWFTKEQRSVVKENNPGIMAINIITILADMWKALEDKSKYIEMAVKDKERYVLECKQKGVDVEL